MIFFFVCFFLRNLVVACSVPSLPELINQFVFRFFFSVAMSECGGFVTEHHYTIGHAENFWTFASNTSRTNKSRPYFSWFDGGDVLSIFIVRLVLKQIYDSTTQWKWTLAIEKGRKKIPVLIWAFFWVKIRYERKRQRDRKHRWSI